MAMDLFVRARKTKLGNMVNVFRRHAFEIYILALFASSRLCYAVSVNMQGSLTLGKEVMEMLTQYVGGSLVMPDGRRVMPTELDFYTEATKTTNFCENYVFCSNELKLFIDEYVIMLGKAVESIFDAVTKGNKSIKYDEDTIFGAEFAKALKEIKPVFKIASTRINPDNEQQIWTGIVKKLSSKVQNRAHIFINNNLEGRTEDIITVRKKLDQKLILAIIAVEERYLNKLCNVHGVCLKYVECTRALNILLKTFKDLDDIKTKEFVKAVEEAIENTDFYANLREETANEFQSVLNEMSSTDIVQAKEVLLSVQKSVNARLHTESTTLGVSGGFDTKLINTILSDMDYVYSKYKPDPFHTFMNSFYEWQKTSNISFRPMLQQVMKRIEHELKASHDDIRFKLSNEVRVFLEITLDP